MAVKRVMLDDLTVFGCISEDGGWEPILTDGSRISGLLVQASNAELGGLSSELGRNQN